MDLHDLARRMTAAALAAVDPARSSRPVPPGPTWEIWLSTCAWG